MVNKKKSKKENQKKIENDKIELCKKIQWHISSLSQTELYEIFKILYDNNSNYTKNNNGIFVNLNWLNIDILNQINNYIIFCIKSHKEIKKHEIMKKMYNDSINKSKIDTNEIYNKTILNNDINESKNNKSEDINITKSLKISSSMKFYLFKKKFIKKNAIQVSNNIYNILTHEEYLIKNDL